VLVGYEEETRDYTIKIVLEQDQVFYTHFIAVAKIVDATLVIDYEPYKLYPMRIAITHCSVRKACRARLCYRAYIGRREA